MPRREETQVERCLFCQRNDANIRSYPMFFSFSLLQSFSLLPSSNIWSVTRKTAHRPKAFQLTILLIHDVWFTVRIFAKIQPFKACTVSRSGWNMKSCNWNIQNCSRTSLSDQNTSAFWNSIMGNDHRGGRAEWCAAGQSWQFLICRCVSVLCGQVAVVKSM